MLGTRPFWKTTLALGAIGVLLMATVVEAAPRSRVRSGNSIHVRASNSCAPRYTNSHHRQRSYGHSSQRNRHYGNHHHNHRNYGHKRSRSSVSIRIGGSYGSYGGCYDYGYTYRSTPRYTYPRYSYSSGYSYGGCTPVYRTRTEYVPVVVDRAPSYGSTYTTTSSDSYRGWQAATRVERTEAVAERPSAPLLPQNDLNRYETNLRRAEAVLEREPVVTYQDDSEPPLGASGSTPTSAQEEFKESEQSEVQKAWAALLEGDAATARVLFADAARVMPKKGEARMGYVIASLRAGDRRAASLSMVRLLESEPQLARGGALPSSTVLQDELARQVETLKQYEDDSVKSYERRMLIAFVDLLRGETAEAQEAMRRARSAGAEGVAARNLWRLVGLSDKPLERLAQH